MTARQSALALTVLLALAPSVARPDTHKVDVAFAPVSYVRQSALFGVDTAVGFTLKKKTPPGEPHDDRPGRPHKPHPWAIMVDLGAHFLNDEDTEITAMAGVRHYPKKWSATLSEAMLADVAKGEDVHPETLLALFWEVLAGVSHRADRESKDSRLAASVGGGVEWMPLKEHKVGFRLQGDWVLVADGESYPRASFFVVFRQPFKEH